MGINFALPSCVLAPYIKRYWAIENSLASGETCVQRIIPTGMSELMLYFTPRPQVLNNPKHLTDNAALYGHQNDWYDIGYTGSLSVFSIVFQPHGLMQFFRFPLNEIYNHNVPLRHLIGQAGRDLEEKMAETTTFEQKLNIIEDFFISSLSRYYIDFEYRRIAGVIELIQQRRGNISIEAMASKACLSRRQFERVFTEQIGATPKQYLKTIRFQNAIYQKQLHKELNMTELSYESGYYDQSHFISEFKSMCGQTPRQFFAENEACSDFFDT